MPDVRLAARPRSTRASATSVVRYVMSVLGVAQGRTGGRRKNGGPTAVEYTLLVCLIAIVMIVAISALGLRLMPIVAGLISGIR